MDVCRERAAQLRPRSRVRRDPRLAPTPAPHRARRACACAWTTEVSMATRVCAHPPEEKLKLPAEKMGEERRSVRSWEWILLQGANI